MTGSGDSDDETSIVILHRYPKYADDCMEILNAEWPRSKGLRLRSLNSSCDQFPTSLVLLRSCLTASGGQEVIGHARVNVLPREENAAWIESVIIRNDLRGKGYGCILMIKTEQFCKACGFTTAYLSTHDRQTFYAKLGYEFCPPVSIYGGSINRNIIPKQFLLSPFSEKSLSSEIITGDICKTFSTQCTVTNKKETTVVNSNSYTASDNNLLQQPVQKSSTPVENSSRLSGAPPLPPAIATPPPPPAKSTPPPPPPPPAKATPPPPPPPPAKVTKNDIQKIDSSTASKMYMKKSLIN